MHRTHTLLSALTLAFAAAGQQPAYRASTQAVSDTAIASVPGGAMLAIPGLADDFVIAGGGQFVELPDGTATLTARIHSETSLYSAFLIDLQFGGRRAPGGPNYPPANAPSLSLQPSAYVPSGPIDPATFVYYTTATGTLRGTHNFVGARINLQLGTEPAQLGHGANNRNGNLGITAGLTLTVVQQPASPFGALTTATLTCDLPSSRVDAATHPQVDPTWSNAAVDRALALPGLGDYVFVPAGTMIEFGDGHAEIGGRLARISHLDDSWQLTLTLNGRIDPRQVGHPPVGSPVLQMLPAAYVGNGGPVDPAHWRYYQTATGTLTGTGINAGGIITLANLTAVQFGGGANQVNLFHGCHGRFSGTVTVQPTQRTIALTGNPELFGLGARFAVLPFPTLSTPTTPYTLPSLTDQGFVLAGDNLAWVELVALDSNLIGLGDAGDWFHGWIRVIDNQHIEVHPRPGLAPRLYDMRALNPAVASNLAHLDLTAPTTAAMYGEAAIAASEILHLMVHRGQVGSPALCVIALSFSNLPTVMPGIVTLGIGNQGALLNVVGGAFAHDPVTGIARFNVGPIPPGFTGFSWHCQAAVIDATTFAFPLQATNVWSVAF